MAIYNIFDYAEKTSSTIRSEQSCKEQEHIDVSEATLGSFQEKTVKRDRFFSSLAARAFFVLLLIADICWGVYVSVLFVFQLLLNVITLFKAPSLRVWLAKSYLNVKRFLVCGLALFVAILSPALGIMFACTYFLMYDKAGIEEVVPASLQEQFKEFFHQ